jgi:uncharacterized membrane protein YccF (DUF307 family)
MYISILKVNEQELLMKLIGNIIWWIFGGLVTAVEYFVASAILMITIVGIPFGLQTMKIGMMTLMPFNVTIKEKKTGSGFLNLIMNIIWFFVGGIWITLTHLILGILFSITIIGIPFGKQHFKLASISLNPFGKEVIQK